MDNWGRCPALKAFLRIGFVLLEVPVLRERIRNDGGLIGELVRGVAW